MKNFFKLFVLYSVAYFQVWICSVLDRGLFGNDVIELAIINVLMFAVVLWKLPEKSLLAVCLVFFLKICGVGLITQAKIVAVILVLAVSFFLFCLAVISWVYAKLREEDDLYDAGDRPQCYQ